MNVNLLEELVVPTFKKDRNPRCCLLMRLEEAAKPALSVKVRGLTEVAYLVIRASTDEAKGLMDGWDVTVSGKKPVFAECDPLIVNREGYQLGYRLGHSLATRFLTSA